MGARSPRKLRRPPARDQLRAVVDETIALYHRIRWLADRMHGDEGRSSARRGILRGLVRYGPQTVPALARKRFVSRQHVQEVVDGLLGAGLVERLPNPRHARSALVSATARGEAFVRSMDARDARVLARAGGGISGRDLEVAARTLRALRAGFERAAIAK
jgi:DNA-binding MarR family transcriptional regulator